MKYCSKCGAELNGRFCSACGYDSGADENKAKLRAVWERVKGWFSNVWSFILEHKKKIIIGASSAVAALVAIIILVAIFGNMYSIIRVSQITVGMSQKQVEAILGEPVETEYSNWYWYESAVAEKMEVAEKLLEDAFASEDDSLIDKIEKALEKYEKFCDEISEMEYKFIVVSFDADDTVSRVFLDQKHKFDDSTYGDEKKEIKNVKLAIDKLMVSEVVDGENVVDISVADEHKLIAYSVEFKDGSYYYDSTRVSVEDIDEKTRLATIKWSDRFGEYEKDIVTSTLSKISTSGELLLWNDTDVNMVLPSTVKSISKDAIIPNKGKIETITFGNTGCRLYKTVLSDFTSLKYNVYECGCYLGTASNPYAYFIKPADSGFSSILHENVVRIAEDDFEDFIYYVRYGDSIRILSLPANMTEGINIPVDVTHVTIDEGITSIPAQAFSGCSSLTSITIPDSVTSIGNYAFEGCSNLENMTLPFIGAEKNGTSNTHLGYIFGSPAYSSNSFYVPQSLKTVVITDCLSIGYEAFSGCSSLTSITIPDSVTSIGSSAFRGCSSLTSITIPDSVTSIGESAFYGCSSLASVNFGDNSQLTSIGYYAFEGCSSLTSITIPDSVTSIGDSAFSGCSSLTSITIPDSVTSIDSGAFSGCSSLTSITIPDSVTSIGSGAFYNCSSLTSITIPDSVTSIGSSAFRGCSSLTSVTIPDSVTSIGSGAFRGCSNLTSVTIGNGVTSIGNRAFSDCSSLTSITFSDTSTWYRTINYNYTGGTATDVTNPLYNASYFRNNYHYYWYKE